jgi:hypothetical protein
MSSIVPPGFKAAHRVIEGGRSAFFSHAEEDLPDATSSLIKADDRLPQFGYVGVNYEAKRILLLGINPGNGPRDRRNPGDQKVMPALNNFAKEKSPASFVAAQLAYREACQGWLLWGRECSELLASAGLGMDDVAFSNALPWRTKSESGFSRAIERRAAENYVNPLVTELRPRIVVAVGRKVARMLHDAGHFNDEVVVWNRARALTKGVLDERDLAKQKFANLASQLSVN